MFRLIFFTLAWLISVQLWADIIVQTGFMDEEVASPLRETIRLNPDKKIIVIERGHVDADSLFQQPMKKYGQESVQTIHVGGGADAVSGQSMERRLAQNLQGNMSDISEVFSQYSSGMHAPKTVGDGAMSVVTFNANATGKDVIVLVRSPEMGLQPGLVQPYLDKTYGAIGQLNEATNGMHFSTFGTSGAIATDIRPGDMSRVSGSVYVGVEVVPGKDGPQYRGVISMIDKDSKAPTHFYRGAVTQDREAAEKAVRRVFNNNEQRAALKPLTSTTAEGTGKSGSSLNQQLRRFQKQNRGRSASLTTSFFAGEKEKDAGRALGLSNVNMEDYHFLNATKGLDNVASLDVTRINMDPAIISDDLKTIMSDWGRTRQLTRADYENLIVWGLGGSDIEHMPDAANWSVFTNMSDEDARKYVYVMNQQGKRRVLDPFAAEIASDLLADFSDGQGLDYNMISQKLTRTLPDHDKRLLRVLVDTRNRELQEAAKEIVSAHKAGMSPEKLKEKIGAMMNATGDIQVPKSNYQIYRQELINLRQKANDFMANAVELGLLDQMTPTQKAALDELQMLTAPNAYNDIKKVQSRVGKIFKKLDAELPAGKSLMARLEGKVPTRLQQSFGDMMESTATVKPLKKSIKPLHAAVGDALGKMQGPGKAKSNFFSSSSRIRMLSATNAPVAQGASGQEVWVRRKKWMGNQARTLSHMMSEPVINSAGLDDFIPLELAGYQGDYNFLQRAKALLGENIDRGIYKSSIVPALQEQSAKRILAEMARIEDIQSGGTGVSQNTIRRVKAIVAADCLGNPVCRQTIRQQMIQKMRASGACK